MDTKTATLLGKCLQTSREIPTILLDCRNTASFLTLVMLRTAECSLVFFFFQFDEKPLTIPKRGYSQM